MLPEGQQFNTSYPVIYWAQSPDQVMVRVVLHPELDTPACKQSFERNVTVKKDSIRVSAYCMQYNKNRTKGIAKKNNTGTEKEFDLDRKRDDESIIDVQVLKDPEY